MPASFSLASLAVSAAFSPVSGGVGGGEGGGATKHEQMDAESRLVSLFWFCLLQACLGYKNVTRMVFSLSIIGDAALNTLQYKYTG